MIGTLYTKLVRNNQKAIVGFLVAAFGTWVAVTGISLDMTVEEALTVLINGVLTSAGVWFKANR